MSYVAGIVGPFGTGEAVAMVDRMTRAMAFRGDAAPERLVIPGAAAGATVVLAADCHHHDDDTGVHAVMEGEIYAAPESPAAAALRAEGVALGILAGRLHRFGRDFPRQVNGAYTAALWNQADRALHLVRDCAGSRSIYFAPIPGGVVFASTVTGVLASGVVDRTLDPASVDCYFGAKALCPPRTMFKQVFALRPGHTLVWQNGCAEQHDYWRLHEVREDTASSAEALRDELRATVEDAVRIRQQAGGRFCALVSGGIDTSAVATLLTRAPDTPRPLHGLSIAFDEIAYSDAGLQDIIVRTLGVDQRERIFQPAQFADTLVKAVGFLDSPVNDAALVGMYAAFGMAREDGYDVVFDGEGPDELFPAGNTQGERGIAGLLRIPQPLRRLTFGLLATSMPLGDSLPDRIRRMCARLALPDDERRMTWRPLYHTAARRHLLAHGYQTGADPYEAGKGYLALAGLQDPINLYQYGLIRTFLPDDLLYKNERMASAHNVMNRTPLVDYRLIELALRIPSRFQIEEPTPTSDGIKLLYKAAMRGIVPDGILDRKKERGFSQPTRVWFAGPLKDFLHDAILGERALARGVFNIAFVQRLFDEHAAGRANHDAYLTSLLVFNLWMNSQENSS